MTSYLYIRYSHDRESFLIKYLIEILAIATMVFLVANEFDYKQGGCVFNVVKVFKRVPSLVVVYSKTNEKVVLRHFLHPGFVLPHNRTSRRFKSCKSLATLSHNDRHEFDTVYAPIYKKDDVYKRRQSVRLVMEHVNQGMHNIIQGFNTVNAPINNGDDLTKRRQSVRFALEAGQSARKSKHGQNVIDELKKNTFTFKTASKQVIDSLSDTNINNTD